MKNVYDNGEKLIGTSKNLQKYLSKQMNNADNDTTDIHEMLEELKDYRDDTVILINYDAPMGYTLEYWSNDNIVDEDKINDEDDEPMDNIKPWEKY